MLVSSLFLASFVVPPQATEWLTFPGEGGGSSVRMRVLAGMTRKAVPNEGSPSYQSYSAQATLTNGSIGMTVKVLERGASETDRQAFRTEVTRLKSVLPPQTQHKTIDQGGRTLKLAYLRTLTGGSYLIEECNELRPYVRVMIVNGGAVKQAEEIMAGLTLDSGNNPTQIYPSGFPRNWSYPVGEETFAFPWAQEAHPTEHPRPDGKVEKVWIRAFDFPDGQLVHTVLESPQSFTIAEAAKRTYPSPVPIDRLYTIGKTDMVKIGERYYLRMTGTSGGDAFLREYLTIVGRDKFGGLSAYVAQRKPGKAWPENTVYFEKLPGLPVRDDAWGMTYGLKSRPVRDGNESLYLDAYDSPASSVPEIHDFGTLEGVSFAVVTGSRAESARKPADPGEPGWPAPSWGWKTKRLAYGFARSGNSWTTVVQHASKDFGACTERTYVKQNGKGFLLEQACQTATAKELAVMEARLKTLKGTDGKPLWPEGRKVMNYVVPVADLSMGLAGPLVWQRLEDHRGVGRAGFVSGRVGVTGGALFVSALDDSTMSTVDWHGQVAELREKGTSGKTNRGTTKVWGREVEWCQSETGSGKRMTSFSWRDKAIGTGSLPAFIHITLPKDSKADSWIEAFEKSGVRNAQGK